MSNRSLMSGCLRRTQATHSRRAVTLALASATVLAATAACGGGSGGSSSQSQSAPSAASNPFKGQTVRFVIPEKPGGGFDRDGRLLSKYLSQTLDATFVPTNETGAGGLIAYNDIAKGSGSRDTVALVSFQAFTTYLEKPQGVNYDPTKFGFVGRFSADPRLLLANPKGKVASLDGMKGASNVRFAAEGPGDLVDARVVSEALGIKSPKYVTGFGGSSEVQVAVLRGDADVFTGSLGSNVSAVKAGTLKAIGIIGKQASDDLPGVPTLSSVAGDSSPLLQSHIGFIALGRMVVAGPSVSNDKLVALQQAFTKIMNDPAFQKDAVAQKDTLQFESGPDLQRDALGTTQSAPANYIQLLKSKK